MNNLSLKKKIPFCFTFWYPTSMIFLKKQKKKREKRASIENGLCGI